jgi:ferredoxin
MSHVIFEFCGREYAAVDGERLLDVLDDSGGHGLPLPCRAGNCGTCRVRVLEGESALAQPTAAEQNLLDLCGAQRNERLGCQIRVKPLSDAKTARRVRIERV